MADCEHWNIGGAEPGLAVISSCKQILNDLGLTNIKITMYDSHYGLIWSGGRPHSITAGQSKERFVALVQRYNSMGVPFNLCFSNLLVEEKHLGDKRCNWVLEQCYREGNGVIVTNHVLAKYIRENFPDYRLIHSLTHFNLDPNYYYDHASLYDVFVLPANFNYEHETLTEFLTRLGPERIECIVNETCFRDCTNQKNHYGLISKSCINGDWDLWERLVNNYCQAHHMDRFMRMNDPRELMNVKTFTLNQQEVNGLKELGVVNFKLGNRQIPYQQYLKFIEYYILDRHNLLSTFTTYENYWRPLHQHHQ
jgi:hypothetical protein